MEAAPGAPLAFAILVGLWHALEPDHVAAVAALIGDGRPGGARRALRSGLAWGIGHALVLAVAGAAILALRLSVTERTSAILEAMVGVMLAAIGVRAVLLAISTRLHAHEHAHDGVPHTHWHAHLETARDTATRGLPGAVAAEARSAHGTAVHAHPHSLQDLAGAVAVGGLHGLAGSAGAALFALAAMPTVAGGVAYLIFFGAGSIAGMGIVATVVGAPLAVARRRYPPLFRALATTAGLASLAIGVVLFWNAGIRHRLFS